MIVLHVLTDFLLQFELIELQELCLDAINKQLSTDNVLEELLSVFTSKYVTATRGSLRTYY